MNCRINYYGEMLGISMESVRDMLLGARQFIMFSDEKTTYISIAKINVRHESRDFSVDLTVDRDYFLVNVSEYIRGIRNSHTAKAFQSTSQFAEMSFKDFEKWLLEFVPL